MVHRSPFGIALLGLLFAGSAEALFQDSFLCRLPLIRRFPACEVDQGGDDPDNGPVQSVETSPYTVFYNLNSTGTPFSYFDGMAQVTESYLAGYFETFFSLTVEADFVSSSTEITGTTFEVGQDIAVKFKTVVDFSEESPRLPTTSELDEVVLDIFQDAGGTNAYTSALEDELPSSNVFSTTSNVSVDIMPVVVIDSGNTTRLL